jgi:hypothetical protein
VDLVHGSEPLSPGAGGPPPPPPLGNLSAIGGPGSGNSLSRLGGARGGLGAAGARGAGSGGSGSGSVSSGASSTDSAPSLMSSSGLSSSSLASSMSLSSSASGADEGPALLGAGAYSKGRRAHMMLVSLDVHETGAGGLTGGGEDAQYSPCVLRDLAAAKKRGSSSASAAASSRKSARGGADGILAQIAPTAAFRIHTGAKRAKRFVITVSQVDPFACVLESCAAVRVEMARVGTNEAILSPAGLGGSRNTEEAVGARLSVWQQTFSTDLKRLTISTRWTPQLLEHATLRRPTPDGEYVLLSFSVVVYVGSSVDPVTLTPTVALRVVDGDDDDDASNAGDGSNSDDDTSSAAGARASFLQGALGLGLSRLERVGMYFRLSRERAKQAEAGVNLFAEHAQQVSKLEHNMRVEQVHQHRRLIKALRAEKSVPASLVNEVERDFFVRVLAAATAGQHARPLPVIDARRPSVAVITKRPSRGGPSRTRVVVRPVPRDDVPNKIGWMNKRGAVVNTAWKSRFFVLRPPFLLYFRKREDFTKGKAEKGVIDLVGATVTLREDNFLNEPFAFEVHVQHRTWVLQADGAREMRDWVDAISEWAF